MRPARSRTLALLAAMTTLTACVTTQPQPDDSTKVNVSLGGLTGTGPNSAQAAAPAPAPAPASASASRPAAVMSQARSAASPSAVAGKGRAPADPKARAQLEQALACKALPSNFDRAESMLKQAGWNSDQGITPVTLGAPIKVYGLSVSKVAVSRDGGEQTYRSHLPGATLQQIAKAASLKLGEDRQTYRRVTKLGVLSAAMEDGEATLTCTIDTEG